MVKRAANLFQSVILYFRNNPESSIYLILIISIFLRLSRLNESLWLDELSSTYWRLKSIGSTFNFIGYDLHPPLYRFAMFCWINLFGDSEISVRIPPLIFGILSIYLTYQLVLEFIDKKTALLTAFLLCVSPVHIWYSQEAKQYSAILFFILLVIFAYYKLLKNQSKIIWYFVYFFSLSAAVFSHYCTIFYLFLISLLTLFNMNKVKRNVLLLNVIIFICFSIFIIWRIQYGGMPIFGGYLRSFNPFEMWMLFFNWLLLGNLADLTYAGRPATLLKHPFLLCIQLFFFIIFCRGLISNLRESKKPYGIYTLFWLFLLPLCFLILSFAGAKHIYIERGVYIILPFFLMIIAKGITGIKTKIWRVTITVSVIIFYAVVLMQFFNMSERWTVYKPKPDWKATVQYFVNEQKNTGAPLFIFTTFPYDELEYYASRFRDPLNNKKSSVSLQVINGKSAKNIYNVITAKKIKTFYFLKNVFWPREFNDYLGILKYYPLIKTVEIKSLKGIMVFKLHLTENQ